MRRFSEDHQMKDEALKLALEALLINCGGNTEGVGKEAITAIKQALAAPVPDWDAWNLISRLNRALESIGDYAHDKSTGPAVPDALWEIRSMAYDAIENTTTPAQPAVPDAFGTREGEHPQYVQGWNDCRAEMLKGRTA
jgi:hypothetical protein